MGAGPSRANGAGITSPGAPARDTSAQSVIAGQLSGAAVKVAYVGAVVPDDEEHRNQAFSRAGNMFQTNLLESLCSCGLDLSLILSQRPMASYPRSDVLLQHSEEVMIGDRLKAVLLPFANLVLIRQLSVGFQIVARLLGWSLRNGRSRRVIFCFNVTEPCGIFAFLAAKLTRSKLVAMIADINIPGQTVPATLVRRWDFAMQKWLLPHLDGIVVQTQAVALDFAPGVPCIQVEGGITVSDEQCVPQPNADNFTVLLAGGLEECNGVREALKAMDYLPREFRLVIAGSGPLEALVRDASNRDPRVQFVGFLTHDEVTNLYRHVDLLLNIRLTQRLNTAYFFPSKLLEFLVSGTPILSTSIECMDQEEWSDLVHLVHDETPTGLAQAMIRVAKTPAEERRATAACARSAIQASHEWKLQGERIRRFVEGLSTA